MDAALIAAHRNLGSRLSGRLMSETCRLAAERIDPSLAEGVTVERDIAYGPHPRHLLNVFAKTDGTARPVLIYVHGGGFVGGDRTLPGQPFYDNIGLWAAQRGWIGVTISYRLAPEHRWPAGAEDVSRAVAWLRENIAEWGGDPARIFVMGQSAGAVHVADFVARGGMGAAGAVLVSAIYDAGVAERNKLQTGYYGEEIEAWGACSALAGLLASDLPLLCAVAEYDVEDFQAQAALFVAAWHERRGTYPPMLRLTGHNHLSTVFQLGSPGDTLGPEIALMIERTTG